MIEEAVSERFAKAVVGWQLTMNSRWYRRCRKELLYFSYLDLTTSLKSSELEGASGVLPVVAGTGLGCKYEMSLPNSVCRVPHFINKISKVGY